MSRMLRSGKKPEDHTPEDPERIVCFACTAASLSTMKHGGISSIPEEKEALLIL